MTDRLRVASTLARRLAHVSGVIEFLLVHERGRGWSGISCDRLLRAADGGAPDRKVGELAEAVLPQLHPDHPLESALRLVQERWPLLPVVHRADSSRLLGVVSLDER